MTTNPLTHMTALDARGDGYHLNNLRLDNGENLGRVDVVSHNHRWMEVSIIERKEQRWIQIRHIISFELIEEPEKT